MQFARVFLAAGIVTLTGAAWNIHAQDPAMGTLEPLGAQQSSLPSPYGPEDTLGAANNLSAEIVREAAGLVRDGKVYSLAIPTGPDTPAFGTRNYQIQVSRIYTDEGVVRGSNRANGNDDLLISWLGIGTQIDGFAHAGVDSHHYNNVPIEDVLRPDGVIRYSIHDVPPIVTRGVLLDIAADLGTELVPGGTAINRAELESAMARQETEVRAGDVVLLHTGSLQLIDSDPGAFMASVAGLGVEGAEYLAGLGVVAVGIDTWALDVIPGENPEENACRCTARCWSGTASTSWKTSAVANWRRTAPTSSSSCWPRRASSVRCRAPYTRWRFVDRSVTGTRPSTASRVCEICADQYGAWHSTGMNSYSSL
ncbi:MAG: cyclase family protein [Proteobacteria bacterium]|nr:cyclase family protein [Pseudomonadota bacterium]MYJ95605.1 cyclase family protein [Pseudomonadota bacterium]